MIINSLLVRRGVKETPPKEHTVLQIRNFGSLDTTVDTKMYVNGVLIEPNLTHVDEDGFRIYSNSYDDYFPYNEIVKWIDEKGNVFKILRRCYVKFIVTGGSITGIDISNEKGEGYVEHPGTYGKSYIAFGKYQGSSNVATSELKSVSGAPVRFNLTRGQYRTQAAANGAGYHSLGIFEWQLLQLLMTHYFGTTNSNNYFPDISGIEQPTGTMDDVKTGYRLSDGKNVFFGIENILKNGRHWLDGINVNNCLNYVNYDYTTWEDNTTTNYISIGTSPSTSDYIMAFGLGNSDIMFPSIIGGTDKTYFADNYYQSTSWRVLYSGSHWGAGAYGGVWTWNANNAFSYTASTIGSRLIKTS